MGPLRGVAEEGLHREPVQAAMAGELGTVVEGDGAAQARRQRGEDRADETFSQVLHFECESTSPPARGRQKRCYNFPMTFLTAGVGKTQLDILVADITTLDVAAIVNAANRSLLGGGGVDGAIHRTAGPELLAECRTLGGCETGSAKITRGYRLKARHVIHAVGPVWQGGGSEEEVLLAGCYRTALDLAAAHRLTSIAYPAISTGVYRFPADLAARIAVGTVAAEVAAQPRGIARVVFCRFSGDSAEHHKEAFGELGLV